MRNLTVHEYYRGWRTEDSVFYEIWGRGGRLILGRPYFRRHIIGILRYPSFITVRTGDQTQNFDNVLDRKVLNEHFLSLFCKILQVAIRGRIPISL